MKTSRSPAHILVTSGATREYIDPVRFISNRSTGEMGLELARAFRKKGFDVTLIRTVSCHGSVPAGIDVCEVETAAEMARQVFERADETDCLVMAAAVSDFTPESPAETKIKKKESLSLRLIKTPDILKSAGSGKRLMKIGFALETGELEKNARKKLKEKGLDLIIGNRLDRANTPFGSGKKDFLVISASGEAQPLKGVTKKTLALEIANRIKIMIT